jgi:O-antigen/teichoic acid export membrane protein
MQNTGSEESNGGMLPISPTSKLGFDSIRYIPSTIIPAAVGIASVSVFTRLFGSELYGRYAVIIAAVTLFGAFFGGWIQQAVLRYLPNYQHEQRLNEFNGKLLIILTFLMLTIAAVAVAAYLPLRGTIGDYGRLYWPGVAMLLGEVAFLTLITLLQAELRSQAYSVYRSLLSVVGFALSLGFVLAIRRDIAGLVIGAGAARLLMCVPMMTQMHLWSAPARARVALRGRLVDPELTGKMLRYGLPLVAFMFGGQMLAIFDRFVIAIFRGDVEVGIYSANYNLVGMGFGLLSTPIITAAHPIIMKAWQKKDGSIGLLITDFSRYYALAVLPAIAFVYVFGRDIVDILLGSDFREGYRIVPLVLAGSAVWGFSMFGHKGLELLERTHVMLRLVAVSVGVNIALNLVFVPKYGYMAAAVTTLVSYLAYPILAHRSTTRELPWRIPWRALIKGVLVAAGVTMVLIAIRLLLGSFLHPVLVMIIALVLSLPAYAGMLLILGAVNRSELRALTGLGKARSSS